MLARDVGFLLGLGLYLLLLGAVRGNLFEHDAFGEYILCVHIIKFIGLCLFFVVVFEIVIKLILEVFHLVDVFVLDGDIVVLAHGTQLIL